MLQIPSRRNFLKMVGAGLASIGLQKLNGQSTTEIPAPDCKIHWKTEIKAVGTRFLKTYILSQTS